MKTVNYLSYCSEKSINGFAVDFLESLDKDDLILESIGKDELLDNQDIILQYSANMLVSYLDYLRIVDNPENLLKSEWIGKGGDKLVILKCRDCYYVVNTTETPEKAFNEVIDSLPSYAETDELSFDVVAVIIGGQ